MPLDHSLIGVESAPHERSWTSADTLLYALGVGAGTEELAFTTENSADVRQRVLPTFAVLAAQAPTGQRHGQRHGRRLGDFDPAMLVHAEQAFELHRELPPAGRVRTTSTVTGIYDKGSGALVTTEARAADAESGESLITSRSSVFIRGEGGFGGERGPRDEWAEPGRPPDHTVTYETRPDQALLYRLSGDRNPLHSDPAFAARAGFPRPILHGLCTYGITGRALLHAVAGSDPARFAAMSGRFSKPVFPGETLTVSIWVSTRTSDGGATALFRTAKEDGTVVIDRGRAAFRPA
ncbi:MaoC family dehydratase [Microbispora bryophytorum]|uniref:MaoC family dehydratase N-terminal domain-containing protein n=1 Tax=Microbispora bryophytorum subsp. camponoti TaxID=1677852 RepID=A0ABR8KT88_9ACTN|nr:MaoC family dehydratase [Microbispora camponoti]MBD3141952.1 MaoC family dehydratase N-terminal domain-containing protein [Microbispora camponoti]